MMLLCAFAPQAWAYDFSAVAPSGQTLYYNIVNGEAQVTYQNANDPTYTTFPTGDLTIPSSVAYNGTTYSVTSIGSWAFIGCSGLTSVTIGNSVSSIGQCAFSDCSGLTSLTIGNSVTSIVTGAFSDCSGLTAITVASGNPTYDSRNNCNAIIKTADNTLIVGCQNTVIPNSVTSIGDDAFFGCSGLSSVTIPNSVTSIGGGAFFGCSGLTSLTIPSSVTSIGDGAFYGCSGLTSLTIPNSVTSIGRDAFIVCSGLTSLTIPNSVTSIGNNAFSFCSGLTAITVASGNPTYDSRNNCNTIIETATNTLIVGCQNTVIPNSVTSIGDYAFSGCSGLTSVTIPNSVTSIGYAAFIGCSGLTAITVASGNPTYDSRNNCNAIIETATSTLIAGCQNTVIPNSVASIKTGAFEGCSGLTSVTIPNSVTRIGEYTFSYCSGLTAITVASGNPTYDSRNNCNAIIETANNTLIAGCQNTVIPNSVTSIGYAAFYGCSGLTSITIPNSVDSIGDYAFRFCEGLTSVTIGNSVTSIGERAFESCSNLAEVTCLATAPSSLGWGAFGDCHPSLTVPCGTEQAYRDSDWGISFYPIQCEEVGIGDVAWEDIGLALQGSTLTIHGATGEPVTVSDLTGRCLYSACAAEPTRVELPSAGVYFVRVGDRPARKVVAVKR